MRQEMREYEDFQLDGPLFAGSDVEPYRPPPYWSEWTCAGLVALGLVMMFIWACGLFAIIQWMLP